MVPLLLLAIGQSAQTLTELQPIWFAVEHRVNAIANATLSLSTVGNSILVSQTDAEIALCQPGNSISISLQEDDSSRKTPIFSGVIVKQELELKKTSATLTLTLRHHLASLESTCRSLVFAEMSGAEIISRIFKEHEVALSNVANMSTKQEQLIQFRCSDWLYTRRLLDEQGAWLLPEPNQVRIVAPKLAAQADRTLKQSDLKALESSGDEVPMFEARWQFDNQYLPKKLTLTGWDIANQTIISAHSTATALGNHALDPKKQRPLSSLPWVMGSSVSRTAKELGALADSALQHLLAGSVQGKFKIMGDMDYQLGQTLALSGFGKYFDGTGIITAIAHNINKEEWTTELSLGFAGVSNMITPLPAVGGLHLGIIDDFKKDPKGLDRMRVKLPILGDSQNVVWARLALPYASKESGFTFYPELGDEVVVGFFDDDPCFPAIVGSMHNPKNKAPLAMSKDNKVKGITIAHQGKTLSLQFNTSELSTVLASDSDTMTMKKGIALESPSNSKIELKSKKINLIN